MQLVDTHCHIHEADNSASLHTETRRRYEKAGMPKPNEIIERAIKDDVIKMVCVGTTLADSRLAVKFVQNRPNCWASIGIHPHEAKDHLNLKMRKEFSDLLIKDLRQGVLADKKAFATSTGEGWRPLADPRGAEQSEHRGGRMGRQNPHPNKIVAIGECGLDYYYSHSPKAEQIELLHFQLGLAQKHDLPLIFHVREASDDFWPIFDQYKGVQGVIHSFSATRKDLDHILSRGLYVGLNGIMTFTKDTAQLEAAKAVPLTSLLLETDAPFLTPNPHRGTICEPKHIRVIAEFLAELRGEDLAEVASITTKNAQGLFKI